MMSDAKVLVVDDIESNRFILVSHLNMQGVHNIFQAENGREALEKLSTNEIDLVLLDVMMPEVDGYEVLERMKADENLRDIPVIMITAVDDMDSTVKCIELGAEDYLSKPFNAVLLRARISACLEKKQLQDVEREYNRFNDFTTGFPNRDSFLKSLSDELLRWQRKQSLFGVFLIRLNNYRKILDSLGQKGGDEFIVAQGKRLDDLRPPGSLLARLGHNEFAIVLSDIDHVADGNVFAQQIHQKLEEPMKIKGHEISDSVDIGLAFSSTGYDSPEYILRDAGLAASKASQSGGYQIFDAVMHKEAMSRLDLETEMKLALAERQFRLFYQPIVALASGEIVGFEALIRWQHPYKGMVPPGEFISLAEETRLIVPMGSWILEEACRQAAEWKTLLGDERQIIIGVNVSARQLKEENFLDTLKIALDNAHIKGSNLKLELTETALIDNPDQVNRVLTEVQKMDLKIALDDFGTGYCSLSYLDRFPIDTLKIDQLFVRQIETQQKKYKIVQSTIDLAHKLGMDVIAEGVETDQELEALRKMNCEYCQGWLFHAALPVEDAAKLLLE
jgi:diguanylate cyclase (GGDEF)-like protein